MVSSFNPFNDTPVVASVVTTARYAFQVPPVVVPGVISIRLADDSTAAAPPMYVTCNPFALAVVVANPVLVILNKSTVGAAVAATFTCPLATLLNVTPPVPVLTVNAVTPDVLPIVIVFAFAPVPILIPPVVVDPAPVSKLKVPDVTPVPVEIVTLPEVAALFPEFNVTAPVVPEVVVVPDEIPIAEEFAAVVLAVDKVKTPAGFNVTVLLPVGLIDVLRLEPLTVNCVKVPAAAAVPPIAGGDAKYVENPAPLTVLLADNVVNAPVLVVVAPIVPVKSLARILPAA